MREIEAASAYFRQHPEAGASVLASEAKQPAGVAAERKANLVTAQSPDLSGALQWPDPEPLGPELPPVQAFDGQLLPEALRGFVSDVAERMQVPPDLPAACAILALAGAVNRRAVIQPKREDAEWTVTPNLWGGIIAPPGWLKSPVLGTVARCLHQIEARWGCEFENEVAEFEGWKQERELREQAWKEEYKRAIKKNLPPPVKPDESRAAPVARRLIVNDPTFEKLHEILRDNPAGVLLLRDELSGWLAILDRQGREGERAFFLEAWNGDNPFTIDRIGRGSIHVPACCVSLVGGIQPARLRQYLDEALNNTERNDGLFQRFQILVWPDFKSGWQLVDRPANAEAAARAARVYESLAELSSDAPLRLKFHTAAQELFYAFWAELEVKVRGGNLHPAFTSHLSKYRSLMPSLGLLFELADSAERLGEVTAVSLPHARQAAAWCEYLESHAARIYGCVVSPELHAARQLGERIRGAALPDTFSLRDVYQHHWAALDTPGAVREAVEVLCALKWVRLAPAKAGSAVGRPSECYQTNPACREGSL